MRNTNMSEYGDMIEPGSLRFERVLPGPVERVWAYLTESERRRKWLAAGPMDLRVGGAVELRFLHAELSPHKEPTPERYMQCENGADLRGRITRLEPPRLLAFTWGEYTEGDGPGAGSEVTFELTPRGESVSLVVTHRRLCSRGEMLSVAGGWHTHLGILADNLHGREPRPFWSTHTALESEYAGRLSAV